ncbi:MAG TPA: DNA internalization-related competence protein ComEC/Rec2 [Candidatus Elarobacter sp.]|nr:DNA internalization-related competence protein ComEC/Rec2 [Candidatus Elarobacter sp.]HEV2738204.1 DNA internalization-related competence protein ComEC/Rec2 [Candidatus Elarobacter sp.]
MARAPLLLPAAGFIAAIVADAHGFAAIACCVALGLLAYRWTRLLAAFALAGLLLARLYGHPPMLTEETRTARFIGTVTGDVRADENGATFVLALDDGIVVRAHVRDGTIVPGERIVVRGRLVPFDEARNPGEPSRRAIALGEGLAGELAGDRVVARAPPDPRDVRTWAARARAALSARLRSVLREPEATVVAGALWGERGTLPRDLRDDFQATGTVHVLVTAGLHLAVIAGLLLEAFRRAFVPRMAASLSAIPCVIVYAWLTGAHLPSQRAAVMVSVWLLARAYGMRLVSWNSLALAALVVAVLWPAAVTTVSFALSFSCVGAIVLFARPLGHRLEWLAMPERAREALALTIATQIGVWPLSAATFGVVAPYAVLANVVVVPATGIAMIAGIVAIAFAQVPVLGRTAATIAAWDVDAILRVVTAVAALPGARIWVAPPPALAIVVYDAVAVIAALVLRSNPRLAMALIAVGSASVLATTLRLPDGRLTVTMLDVGQGDAIVVRTPHGHTILVDSGGRLERGPGADGRSPAELVGERVVLAYLKRQGIRRVDLLLNTHPHGDHVGGFAPIVRALRVDAIADSGQSYGGRAFNDGLREAAAHHVPVHVARCGDRWATGDGVALSVLSPCGALFADGKNDVNENSVIVKLTYHDFRMLFMGDAGFQAERRLLESGFDVRADVLKVGHHGSAYASGRDFLDAVRARVALISDGRHNTFGHPAPSTLATLQRAGVRAYRTDHCGAITVHVDALHATTMLPCR